MNIRIIIADDHPIVRAGTRGIVSADSFIDVVGEAGTPEELLQLLAVRQCDVLVTDFTMPGTQPDGLPMLAAIRRRFPKVRIVLFTVSTNARLIQLLSDSGVKCIVTKTAAMQELPEAIKAAARGKRYLGASVRSGMPEAIMDEELKNLSHLSPREIEVLRLIATGRTVSEIAALQNRSVATISHQKISGMRKLSLTNDADLHVFLRSGALKL